MNEAIPPSLREVWEWKRATEQATAGMSKGELIEFYRRQADEVQRMLGIELPRHPASSERHAAEPWNRHR